MKNINSILKKIGLEVPEDKKEELDKLVAENYKTISEVDKIKSNLEKVTEEKESLQKQYDKDIEKRDKDLKSLQTKLEKAGTDADELKNTIAELDKLKTDYDNSKAQYEKDLAAQKYTFAIRERANALEFTSNAAKKQFIADVTAEQLKMKDNDILGFDDYVAKYKEEDAGVFKVDSQNTGKGGNGDKKPHFSTKSGNKDDGNSGDNSKPKERPLIW